MSLTTRNKRLDSLKHVICYLEPNLRSQVVNRMPGIRSADKSPSVKIRDLSFFRNGLKLNETTYELGIIRLSREGKTPSTIVHQNNIGGVHYELNQFGVRDNELGMKLAPGDILLADRQPAFVSSLEEARMLRDGTENFLRDVLEQRMETADVNSARASAERAQLQLDALIRQRDNVPTPFDMYIQLTKSTSDGIVSVERFNYNQNLAAAQKYLMTKLLGHYRGVLNIDTLEFYSDYLIILRLPEGLKLSARNLSIDGPFSKFMDQLKPILADLDRPLDSLYIGCFDLEDCAHPVVQNAKLLVTEMMERELETLRAITNRNFVHIDIFENLDTYGALIEHWMETGGRDVGTCFKFFMDSEDEARDVLRRVKERFNEAMEGERLLTIPFPNSTQLNISDEAVIGDLEYGIRRFMKMEIVSLNE